MGTGMSTATANVVLPVTGDAPANGEEPIVAGKKPSGMLRLLGKGFWAILDQALFAGSNFILNIVLARWLSESEYGAFGVAFSVFLLVGTLHTSLLTEPMMVFGSGRYRDRTAKYLGALLYGNLGFAIPCALLLALSAWIVKLYGNAEIATALFALAIAGPFMLFLWFMRRACYVRMAPSFAAWGGILYMGLMLGGLFGLYKSHHLSAATAQGVMGASSLIVALGLVLCLRVQRPDPSAESHRQIVTDHWQYGRWAAATQAIGWFPRQIYYVLLPACRDLAQGGTLRALMNLTLPLTQANTALALILIPVLVKARREGNFRRMVYLSLGLFMASGGIYWLALGVFQRPIVSLVYGGRYGEYGNLLWLVGSSLVFAGVIDVLGSALRAMERPDTMFWSNLFSTIVAVAAGLVCMALWGVVGAAIGLLLSSVLKAVAMWIYYRRLERQEDAKGFDVVAD
jgi:O-antigen/teichoic acid export membrane protein